MKAICRALVLSFLTLSLGAVVTACDNVAHDGQRPPTTAEQDVDPQDVDPADPFVGTWTIEHEIFPSGRTYTRDDLEATDQVITLEVRDDGTFLLSDGTRTTDDVWKPTGTTTATFWADGTPAEVTVADGLLTLRISDGPTMVFTRS